MLLNEINSVNTKFDDISAVIKRLADQAADRMGEAQVIIGEAKKAVDKGENDGKIQKAEAPVAKFEAAVAPTVDVKPSAVNTDIKSDKKENDAKPNAPFANMGDKSFNKPNNNGFNNNSFNSNNNNNKPADPKAAQQKKLSNINMDMAELLKAAEEEAAKNPEEE
jgi:hypothetical protein